MEHLVQWLAAAQARHTSAASCRGSRPLVTLSYAQSLDGCLAARRGQPLALSGPEAMRITHQMRAWHDAILVGVETVLADNPRLTVRLVDGPNPQPVILDSRLRTPPDAWLVCEHPRPAWIATVAENGKGGSETRPYTLPAPHLYTRLLELPAGPDGHVSLPALLDQLGALGVRRLMVEGGARVLSAFISQGMADLAVITVSPQFVGGLHIIEADPRPEASGAFPRLERSQSAQVGPDLLVWGCLRTGPTCL